ncbi:hypothetical protein N7517_008366 [Penicillium concentricum]|uniref:Uncharacterized protein n=1 Tax=Penicillium concentricum TaxID=293559 RepID=A0A9W9RSB7_9EURO|nr:uncharacterized protein N7517_008366 [Penicillium concentricum]KAJ5365480.1 hypothetical protein N7517_008366 [Penicillium concentricum]
MQFKDRSCNIIDKDGKDGKTIHSFNAPDDSPIVEETRNVSVGNLCYIMLANVKFDKGHNAG